MNTFEKAINSILSPKIDVEAIIEARDKLNSAKAPKHGRSIWDAETDTVITLN